MAGKNSEGSCHQAHQGPCEEELRELEKGHVEGHLRAACLQGGCSLQWGKAEQQHTTSLEIEIQKVCT